MATELGRRLLGAAAGLIGPPARIAAKDCNFRPCGASERKERLRMAAADLERWQATADRAVINEGLDELLLSLYTRHRMRRRDAGIPRGKRK